MSTAVGSKRGSQKPGADFGYGDQHRLVMTDRQWTAFQDALEAPAKPRPRLDALLHEPSVFDGAVRPT